MSGIQGKLCMLGHSMTELLTVSRHTKIIQLVDDHFFLDHAFPHRTVPRSGRARAPVPTGRWGGWLSDRWRFS